MMSRLLKNFSKSYSSNDPNDSLLIDLTDNELTNKCINNINTTTTNTTATSAISNTIPSTMFTTSSTNTSVTLISHSSSTNTPKTSTQCTPEIGELALLEAVKTLSSSLSASPQTTLGTSEEQVLCTTKSATDTSIPPVKSSLISSHVQQSHHWREGNLPVNSKCASCRKTCWSAECLTGLRCEWCGVTVSGIAYFFSLVKVLNNLLLMYACTWFRKLVIL